MSELKFDRMEFIDLRKEQAFSFEPNGFQFLKTSDWTYIAAVAAKDRANAKVYTIPRASEVVYRITQ